MAERSPEELQRVIASAREDLLMTVGRMRVVIHRNLSIFERIKRRPIAAGAAAAALFGVVLAARMARTEHAMRRPRLCERIAGTLRRLCRN
jgi:hypothetical protein